MSLTASLVLAVVSGHGEHRAPRGTDLMALDRPCMAIIIAYEVRRLARGGVVAAP